MRTNLILLSRIFIHAPCRVAKNEVDVEVQISKCLDLRLVSQDVLCR